MEYLQIILMQNNQLMDSVALYSISTLVTISLGLLIPSFVFTIAHLALLFYVVWAIACPKSLRANLEGVFSRTVNPVLLDHVQHINKISLLQRMFCAGN